MVVFADTSALYALLDQSDKNHVQAAAIWRQWAQEQVTIVTSNYVLLECHTLIQSRLGLTAVREFYNWIVPLLAPYWVDDKLHQTARTTLLAANRRQLSLVDCASFVVMQTLNVQRVFAFDRHFAEQGFTVLPREEDA